MNDSLKSEDVRLLQPWWIVRDPAASSEQGKLVLVQVCDIASIRPAPENDDVYNANPWTTLRFRNWPTRSKSGEYKEPRGEHEEARPTIVSLRS
jgi:hypothetical protein